MRYVISGGSGMLGSGLCRSLVADGHRVQVLTRSALSDQKSVGQGMEGVEWLHWDGQGRGDWVNALDGADGVIHLAGASLAGTGAIPARWTREYKQQIRQSRVDSGRLLASVVSGLDRPPKVFVQASGVGYYGIQPEEDASVLDEASPRGAGFLADLCRDWEASTQSVIESGVRHVVIRTGVVLDPDQGALPKMVMPIRLRVGGRLGSGRQVISWIHLQDEIGAIRFLLDKDDCSGAYNLVAPEPLSNSDFGRVLARQLHRPFLFPAPAWVMRMMLGEAADLVLTGQRVVSQRLEQAGFRFTYPGLKEAAAQLYP